jgi:hypothetical protein
MTGRVDVSDADPAFRGRPYVVPEWISLSFVDGWTSLRPRGQGTKQPNEGVHSRPHTWMLCERTMRDAELTGCSRNANDFAGDPAGSAESMAKKKLVASAAELRDVDAVAAEQTL